VELGGAAQGLTGADAAGALPGVMDDDHGDAVPALQLAQIGKQRRNLAGGVLVIDGQEGALLPVGVTR
jgi:hypothetical protein